MGGPVEICLWAPLSASAPVVIHCLALLTTSWAVGEPVLIPRLPGLCPALGRTLLFSCLALLEAGAPSTGPRQALGFGQLLADALALTD